MRWSEIGGGLKLEDGGGIGREQHGMVLAMVMMMVMLMLMLMLMLMVTGNGSLHAAPVPTPPHSSCLIVQCRPLHTPKG